jgi:hypothetical protein
MEPSVFSEGAFQRFKELNVNRSLVSQTEKLFEPRPDQAVAKMRIASHLHVIARLPFEWMEYSCF